MIEPTDPTASCFCASPVSHIDSSTPTDSSTWPIQEFDSAGLPLLDPIETSVPDPSTLPESTQTEADRQLSRSFRHAGWAGRRGHTLNALTDCGFPPARIQRFAECGSTAFVLRDSDGSDHFRIASNRCHDRFCVPCALEKTRCIAINLLDKLPDAKLRFITLTQRSTDFPLRERLDKLYADFARLRKVLHRHEKITGGIAFLEITRNQVSNQWHPHLHVIASGKFIPQSWLRDRWLEITGDSYIVDVRLIRDKREAALYVTKYASKTLSPKVWNDYEALREAILALSGRRTFNVFGNWTAFHLSKPPTDNTSWVFLATLPDLIRRHQQGDSSASRILSLLANGGIDEPVPVDLPVEQDPDLPGL